MRTTTLSFLVKEGEVLLAMKKRGFGVGKWNGVGGKIIAGETIEQSAVREIKEEIGVDVQISDLRDAGTLRFSFDGNSDWNQACRVFTIQQWKGELAESEEMRPQWYPVNRLPFDEMWVDDPHWLPKVLTGQAIDGEFLFNKDGSEMLDFKVIP